MNTTNFSPPWTPRHEADLVSAIVKAVPEIKEWKPGCKVIGMHGETLTFIGQRELGKPPVEPLDWKYPRAKGRHTHADVFQKVDGTRYEYAFSDAGRILGRPITLEDVLRALPPIIFAKNDGGHIELVNLEFYPTKKWKNTWTRWVSGKPLSDQSEPTKQFLYSLLCAQ